MSSIKPLTARVCSECGADNPVAAVQCWLCGGKLAHCPITTTRLPTPYERHASLQFSFASLMLTIALIAVLLGVFRLVPGLGVILAVIVGPAWIRTCITVVLRQSRGRRLTLGDKTSIFAASIAIMVGVGVMFIAAIVAALAAFCGVLAASGRGGGIAPVMGISLAVLLVSGLVLVAVGAALWRTMIRSRRKVVSTPGKPPIQQRPGPGQDTK